MDKYRSDDVIPTDTTDIRGKYPVYSEGSYLGIIYKVIPKWQVSMKGNRFCRYWVIVLLLKNLTTGAEFEKPVQFWFFPGTILKSGLGRGWNIDLNEMASGLGITLQKVDGKKKLPLSGAPIILSIKTIEIKRHIITSVTPVFGERDRMVDEKTGTVKIVRNTVEHVWNANDHLEKMPIPDEFDLDKYDEEQKTPYQEIGIGKAVN